MRPSPDADSRGCALPAVWRCRLSLHRFATRRDTTEPAIFRALRQAGADVLRLDVFDALVLFRGKLFLMDCKSPRGKQTQSQRDLVLRGWPLRFVTTAEEALRVIGAHYHG